MILKFYLQFEDYLEFLVLLESSCQFHNYQSVVSIEEENLISIENNKLFAKRVI